MQQHGRLGSNDTHIAFDYVTDMHHNEFSDTGMLTPTWLARAVGLTGPRNPIESAKDVAQRTLDFLHTSRQWRGQGKDPAPLPLKKSTKQ